MKKRNRLDIIHDILSAISDKNGTIKPTHLLYKSNLSHKVMEGYLKELKDKSLITEEQTQRSKTFSLTEKGYDFLSKYKNFVEFIDAFDLQE